MDDMTKEEIEEFQERLSKFHAGAPETLAYSTKQRLRLLANLMYDRAMEDWNNGAPIFRKIEQENAEVKDN